MATVKLTPLYSRGIGLDRLATVLDTSLRQDQNNSGYPAYDLEAVADNHYALTLAVVGFDRSELDIQVENNVLTVTGQPANAETERNYLHRGIARRSFERRFTLAEHVEVEDARLERGLLTVELVKRIPEALKPRSIAIQTGTPALEQKDDTEAA